MSRRRLYCNTVYVLCGRTAAVALARRTTTTARTGKQARMPLRTAVVKATDGILPQYRSIVASRRRHACSLRLASSQPASEPFPPSLLAAAAASAAKAAAAAAAAAEDRGLAVATQVGYAAPKARRLQPGFSRSQPSPSPPPPSSLGCMLSARCESAGLRSAAAAAQSFWLPHMHACECMQAGEYTRRSDTVANERASLAERMHATNFCAAEASQQQLRGGDGGRLRRELKAPPRESRCSCSRAFPGPKRRVRISPPPRTNEGSQSDGAQTAAAADTGNGSGRLIIT